MFIITLSIIFFIALYVIYVNFFWLYHKKDKIPKILHKPLYLLGGIGYLLDIIYNIFLATFIFMDPPKFRKNGKFRLPPLTARLKRYILTEDGWRFDIAYFICRRMLEPWDPNHCGLEDIDIQPE